MSRFPAFAILLIGSISQAAVPDIEDVFLAREVEVAKTPDGVVLKTLRSDFTVEWQAPSELEREILLDQLRDAIAQGEVFGVSRKTRSGQRLLIRPAILPSLEYYRQLRKSAK